MFGVPDNCKIGNTIFKKMFYENGDLNTSDKEIFTNAVDKILWLYCLKPETTNIKVYTDEIRDYSEIEVLEVRLQKNTKIKRIAEIIMKTIPYPMILVFSYENKFQIWTAHQRTNLNDNTKNTLEDFIFTDWINEDAAFLTSLDIKNFNLTDFYNLYYSFVDAISIHNAKDVTDKEITGEQARELTSKIEQINAQILALKAQAKKETQFNKRVEINLMIRQLGNKKNKLMEE